MIEWKEIYALGISVVDEQHKRLFEIAGNAEEMLLMADNIDKYDDIKVVVEELRDYVVFHFEEEEKMMQEIIYPKYFTHRIEHQDFIDAMYKIEDESIEEDQNKQLLHITTTVINWITDHVFKTDKLLADYYKETKKES